MSYRLLRPLPFSRSSLSSSFLKLPLKTAVITMIAITAITAQPTYALAASNMASICSPFDPDVVGFKLFQLIAIVVLLNVLLTVVACHAWGQFLQWAESRADRGAK
jgi:hypothetical protein